MMKASREDKAGAAGGEQEGREEQPMEQGEGETQSEFKGKGKLTVSQYTVRHVLLCFTQSPL